MPKPVCVPCQRFFRPKRNGYRLTEGMPIGNDVRPGTEDAARWKPYKAWIADLWECQGCGAQIVTGFGHEPLSVHHMPDFEAHHKLSQMQVNDC